MEIVAPLVNSTTVVSNKDILCDINSSLATADLSINTIKVTDGIIGHINSELGLLEAESLIEAGAPKPVYDVPITNSHGVYTAKDTPNTLNIITSVVINKIT